MGSSGGLDWTGLAYLCCPWVPPGKWLKVLGVSPGLPSTVGKKFSQHPLLRPETQKSVKMNVKMSVKSVSEREDESTACVSLWSICSPVSWAGAALERGRLVPRVPNAVGFGRQDVGSLPGSPTWASSADLSSHLSGQVTAHTPPGAEPMHSNTNAAAPQSEGGLPAGRAPALRPQSWVLNWLFLLPSKVTLDEPILSGTLLSPHLTWGSF